MIGILVINYKKSDLTLHLCESLAKQAKRELLHVVIVDNAADTASRKALSGLDRYGFSVEVLHETENWGYFGGARVGYRHLVSSGGKCDWIILSNSDIEFRQPDFLSQLSAYPRSADLGLLAPRIVSGLSGKSQNPYMLERPAAKRMHFYKWVFRYKLSCFIYQLLGLAKSLLKRKLDNTARASETARDIYAAHGSFMVFTDTYFGRGGSFAHGPFLFGEEVTVAENCRRLGLRIRYEPKLEVEHVEHATMGWIPSGKMLEFQKQASEFCADTYFQG